MTRFPVVRPWFEPSPYLHLTEAAGARTFEVYNRTYWPRSYGRDPREEFEAIMERAVLIDVGCERIVEVTGPDALDFVDYLCTRDLLTIPPDRARHTAICEPNGELYCEAIVLRVDEDCVWVGHGPVDFLQWSRAIAAHTDFDVFVDRPAIFPFAVQGPKAVEIMQGIAPSVVDLPFFGWRRAEIAGTKVVVVRSGWSGSPGFEIYPLDRAHAAAVWEAVAAAGEPFGLLVAPMTGPHFERAVTDLVYGAGLRLNPFEAGLAKVVNLDARPFLGREALVSARDAGLHRELVGLRFGGAELPEFERLWALEVDNSRVGTVIAAKRSLLLEEWLAYAVISTSVGMSSIVQVLTPLGFVEAAVTPLPFVA